MAENETLDLESRRRRRWQQWGQEWASGNPVRELAESAFSKLIQTFRNPQKLFADENGVPLSGVLDAVVGQREELSSELLENDVRVDFSDRRSTNGIRFAVSASHQGGIGRGDARQSET